MMRFLHLIVIGTLLFGAAYVYRIKMESTFRTEQVMKLRADIRTEREQIAALRAEWSRLDNPARLQDLAQRHTQLRRIDAMQFDALANLPAKPPSLVPPGAADPIGALLDAAIESEASEATGSIPSDPEEEPQQ
jgi:hypothetical protein